MEWSQWRIMWIIVTFDLPTDTAEAKRAYRLFRKFLLNDGYTMLQYSVYARSCTNESNLDLHIKRVQNEVPGDGEVRVIKITDKQFGNMLVFQGKIREEPEKPLDQLLIF